MFSREYIHSRLKKREADDERQFMVKNDLEVYEKEGAPVGAISLHYHNFYEIIYIVDGEFSSFVENETFYLKRGDFLLIPQNAMHKYNYQEGHHDTSKRIILWISEELLLNLSKESGSQDVDYRECFLGRRLGAESQADRLTELSNEDRRARSYHFPVYYDELLRSFLFRLAEQEPEDSDMHRLKNNMDRGYLLLLFSYIYLLSGKKENYSSRIQKDYNPLVDMVSTFIEENLDSNITVDELAEYVHMSKFHFIRKFKESTGVTVHSFVIQKRLIKACDVIKQGGNVMAAFEATGFMEYSVFTRNFKKVYGVSPSKYKEYYM